MATTPRPSRTISGIEPADPQDMAGITRTIPAYTAIRTARYSYVEYATGERELYDLQLDPDQLLNTVPTAEPALLARLARALDELRRCGAKGCAVAEDSAP